MVTQQKYIILNPRGSMNTLSRIDEIISEYGSFEAYEEAKLNEPIKTQLTEEHNGFTFKVSLAHKPNKFYVDTALEDPSILLTGGCHVDHEGFDLNEIEQAYYKAAGVVVTKDSTWYKDGGGDRTTTAILQPWIEQLNDLQFDGKYHFILDHSHFVFKYPIIGEAARQIIKYVPQRPELLRLLSTRFKCGLDLCIDVMHCRVEGRVQPFVHIEWDYETYEDLYKASIKLSSILRETKWHGNLDAVLNFNTRAVLNKIDAFEQADFRAMLMFGDKSYKLIPTL